MTAKSKQLVVLSGKGGTGKTSVTAAIADLAHRDISLCLADADVDASNLSLVMQPERPESHAFFSGLLAHIDPELCIGCGACGEACRFDAIEAKEWVYEVNEIACEGCAACKYHCPVEAITMREPQAGEWYIATTPYGRLYHAHLSAGGENSGKLVTLVKQQARLYAGDNDIPFVLVDGPPGIGCPVISSLSGADAVLIVTEPTPSGVHDMERVLGLVQHFGVKPYVLINKVDISTSQADRIENYCEAQGVKVVAKLPFDEQVTRAMVAGVPITAYSDCQITYTLQEVWSIMKSELGL